MNWFDRQKYKFVLWRARKGLDKNMKGWKTWSGSIALMLSGAALALVGFTEGDMTKVLAGIAAIGKGLSDIGVGHKIEKAATGKPAGNNMAGAGGR